MKSIYKILLLFSIISLTILSASLTKEEINNMKKIVGYFPNWGVYGAHRKFYVNKIKWGKVTHINVAFAKVTKDTFVIQTPDKWADIDNTYGESWNSKYSGNYGQLRKIKVAYPNVSVLISIGGWTLSGQFADAGKTEENRKKFSINAVSYMKNHGFDGVDIDWEYPTNVREPDKIDNIRDEGTLNEIPESKQNFTLLLKELRVELDKQGEIDNRYYQLTAAVSASPRLIAQTEPEKYIEYLDFVNVMSYDLHGAWDKKTNHQSPLYENSGLPDDNLSVYDAVKLLSAKIKDKTKIIIGSPFYSRGWKGVDCTGVTFLKDSNGNDLEGLNCPAKGGAKGNWDGGRAGGVNAWFDIVNKMIGKDGFKVYRDTEAKVPYLYSKTKKEFYTYEDEVSAEAKVDFVKDNGYGGIIIWELSADIREDLGESKDKSLLNAIYNKLYEGNEIIIFDEGEKKNIDNSYKQKGDGRELNKEDGSANIITTLLVEFDANRNNYNTDDQILYTSEGVTQICTAKWWVKVAPPNPAWDCETSKDIFPSTVLTEEDKEKVIDDASKIAEKLKDDNLDVDKDTNTTNIAKEKVDKTGENTSETDTEILTKSQLAEKLINFNKCHNGKVYKVNDICKYEGSWYKFKWWTQFEGNVNINSMKKTLEEEKPPELKIIASKGLKKWSNSKTYPKSGMKVVYNGNIYESKYWTSGNKPIPFISNSPWKYIGLADNSKEAEYKGVKTKTPEEITNTKASKYNPLVMGEDEETTTATFDKENGETVITQATPKKEEVEQNTPTEKFFMPFVDTILWPPYKLSEGIEQGINNFALSFVNSSNGVCSPTWGTHATYTIDNSLLNLVEQIKEVAKNGGSVMISFGGATAHLNELAEVCKTAETLAEAYQEVIDLTGVKMIDFDIEGTNSYNKVNVKKRMQALKIIQDNNPDIEISFTLATMPTGLLSPSGLMIVKTAIAEEVKFKMINLMLMDYGTSFPANIEGDLKMAAYSIQALQSVNEQLKKLLDYPKVNQEYYHLLGAIPMIGRNDTLNEYFYRSDIEKFIQWCDKVGIRMVSMWSLNRDKALATGESEVSSLYKSTKLKETQYGDSNTYEFSKLLQRKGN